MIKPKRTPKTKRTSKARSQVKQKTDAARSRPILRKSNTDIVENYSLPASYNTTRLILMARDPYWLHAYWEIASEKFEDIKNQMGDVFHQSVFVLRLYDITAIDFNGWNAHHQFDIEVGCQSNNWYINLWNAGASYTSDIGMRTPDGQFFPMARSNCANTPRDSFSGRSDMIWMNVQEEKPDKPFVRPRTKIQYRREAQRRKDSYQPSPKGKKGRMFHLTENDIRAYYANLFPLLRKVRGKRKGNGSGPQRSLRDILGLKKFDLEVSLIDGLSRSEYYKKLLLGASAEMMSRGGASERREGISSGASVQEMRERKFFFELWTELIVYGRTEPDAEVRHGNKAIKLRGDGTFTLRFALPDGKIPLDFVAQSADQIEKRSIVTSVERAQTEYNTELSS